RRSVTWRGLYTAYASALTPRLPLAAPCCARAVAVTHRRQKRFDSEGCAPILARQRDVPAEPRQTNASEELRRAGGGHRWRLHTRCGGSFGDGLLIEDGAANRLVEEPLRDHLRRVVQVSTVH